MKDKETGAEKQGEEKLLSINSGSKGKEEGKRDEGGR